MVEIQDTFQLEEFLEGKPAEWVSLLAVRAALRTLPNWRTPDQRSDLTLQLFRAMFVCKAILQWPSLDMRRRAYDAADEVYNATVTAQRAFALSGAVAVYSSARAIDAVARSSGYSKDRDRSHYAAIDAIEYTNDWKSIGRDAFALERGSGDPNNLRNRLCAPLWEDAVDRDDEKFWEEMKADLLTRRDESWTIWIEWYERILAGQRTAFSGVTPEADKEFCVRLATEPDEFWGRDVSVVNAEIAERLNTLRPPDVPVQAPGPLITYERDGRVARQLPSPPDDPKGTLHSARQNLIDAVDDFEMAFPSHNHFGLKQTLVRLREALGADYDQFDIIRAGTAAERLQGFALRADEIFLPEMAVEVVALNVNIGRTLGNSGDWREFCHGLDNDADAGVVDIQAVKEVGQALIKTDALEDEVKQELNDEVLAIEWEDAGPRDNKILTRGVMNVLATMSKIGLDYAKFVQGAAGEGHKDGIKKIAETATVGAFMGLAALLLPLAGQSPMFAFLVPVLSYLSKFADK